MEHGLIRATHDRELEEINVSWKQVSRFVSWQGLDGLAEEELIRCALISRMDDRARRDQCELEAAFMLRIGVRL
jgi:hypothetical protein